MHTAADPSQAGIPPSVLANHVGNASFRDALNHHPPGAQNVSNHIGDDQPNEDRKENHAHGRALEPVAKVLDLGAVAVLPAEVPEFHANRKKQAEWMIPDQEAICP